MHDFLGLLDTGLGSYQMILLTGKSGAGKSTAIQLLTDSHPDFRDKQITRLKGSPLVWPKGVPDGEIVVLDELTSVRDLFGTAWLLRHGKQVIAANHLSEHLFAPLKLWFRVKLFRCDRGEAKLCRYLSERHISYHSETVRHYTRQYGSVYTELQIILERCPADSFEASLSRFEKHHSITVERARTSAQDGSF